MSEYRNDREAALQQLDRLPDPRPMAETLARIKRTRKPLTWWQRLLLAIKGRP